MTQWSEKAHLRAQLQGSFMLYCQTFYPLLTNNTFIIPNPIGRENHVLTVCRGLTQAFRLELPTSRLLINIPPGHFKSTMVSLWVSWCMSQYPDSNFIYVSYSSSLATEHTSIIRQIMMLPHYTELFDVELRKDSQAKDFFKTTAGGAVAAFGSAGAITGRNCGLPGLDRFTGALIIDDAHKPDDVHSDTIREGIIQNYGETLNQRVRSSNVPRIFIGQRLRENDLPDYLLQGNDGYAWKAIIIQSLDEKGQALFPESFPVEYLEKIRLHYPYVWASQHQQNPQPAGGSLYKEHWFVRLDREPDILATFITVDTAETDKTYNDATVFSFWGVYKIKTEGITTDVFGLHWIDCVELRIEPKDLKAEFLVFWQRCMLHRERPKFAAIEKKSTGVTLVSVLSDIRGIQIRPIERTSASGSKTQRLLEIQSHLAEMKVSFTADARHIDMCVTHMTKITGNNTHAFDDIADTCVDACNFVYKLHEFDHLISTFEIQRLPTFHAGMFT